MDLASGITHRPAEEIEYPTFLRMIYEHTTDYLEPSLVLLGMDQAEFEYLFRTRGRVEAILLHGIEAGFYWVEERGDTLHIHGLFIRPELQKQGIARRILTDIEREAQPAIRRFEVGVHRDNQRAKGVYEAAGYSVVRDLPDFDFYVMEKARA